LSGILKRLAPNLRAVGVEAGSGRTNKGRYIALGRVAESSVTNVTRVTTPEDHGDSADQRDARVTQSPAGVTLEYPENAVGDASDDEIPSLSGGAESDLSAEKGSPVCLHKNVEETPTFDGYVNRQCRDCGQDLLCRRPECTSAQD
jgi:hypothetical protein